MSANPSVNTSEMVSISDMFLVMSLPIWSAVIKAQSEFKQVIIKFNPDIPDDGLRQQQRRRRRRSHRLAPSPSRRPAAHGVGGQAAATGAPSSCGARIAKRRRAHRPSPAALERVDEDADDAAYSATTASRCDATTRRRSRRRCGPVAAAYGLGILASRRPPGRLLTVDGDELGEQTPLGEEPVSIGELDGGVDQVDASAAPVSRGERGHRRAAAGSSPPRTAPHRVAREATRSSSSTAAACVAEGEGELAEGRGDEAEAQSDPDAVIPSWSRYGSRASKSRATTSRAVEPDGELASDLHRREPEVVERRLVERVEHRRRAVAVAGRQQGEAVRRLPVSARWPTPRSSSAAPARGRRGRRPAAPGRRSAAPRCRSVSAWVPA